MGALVGAVGMGEGELVGCRDGDWDGEPLGARDGELVGLIYLSLPTHNWLVLSQISLDGPLPPLSIYILSRAITVCVPKLAAAHAGPALILFLS